MHDFLFRKFSSSLVTEKMSKKKESRDWRFLSCALHAGKLTLCSTVFQVTTTVVLSFSILFLVASSLVNLPSPSRV